MKRLIPMLFLLVLVTGCADKVSFSAAATMTPVGFWHGCWHGMTQVFAFIGSRFDNSIAVYAIYNNGGWYDCGFVLGIFWWLRPIGWLFSMLASLVND